MTTLRPILQDHPFFRGLSEAHLDVLVGCAKNVRFNPGDLLFEEGQDADSFYLIRFGRVVVELHAHGEPLRVKTVSPGEVLGWSWLVPPHKWGFDARAIELTRALSLDGACLRRKCEADPSLGFELLKRVANDLDQHLHRAWLQMADVYGPPQR